MKRRLVGEEENFQYKSIKRTNSFHFVCTCSESGFSCLTFMAGGNETGGNTGGVGTARVRI